MGLLRNKLVILIPDLFRNFKRSKYYQNAWRNNNLKVVRYLKTIFPISVYIMKYLLQTKQYNPIGKYFFSSLLQTGTAEIENRNNDILRLLKENGVAYNIYNDPSGQSRPWELDPIPQIIPAKEWETINAGLIQRAELFDLILKDIYGPQTLIKNGIIPQELIYLHPGFFKGLV